MADSVEINPEFEDDDAFDRRINEQRNRTLRSEGPSNVSAPDLSDLLFEVNTMSPRAAQTRAFTPQSMNKGGRPKRERPPRPTALQAQLPNFRGGAREGPPPVAATPVRQGPESIDNIMRRWSQTIRAFGPAFGAGFIAQRTFSLLNNSVARAGDFGAGLARGDRDATLTNLGRSVQALDITGIGGGTKLAVTGFEKLLDINQGILDATRQNLGFAPQSLQADVRGNLLRLGQQIQVTSRLDKMTAELIKANTRLDLAFGELRAEFIEVITPLLLDLLPLVTTAVELLRDGINDLGEGGPLQVVLGAIHRLVLRIVGIAEEEEDKDEFDVDVFNQLLDFFDPNKQAAIVPQPQPVANP